MLLPCATLVIVLWGQQQTRGSWSTIIHPDLLAYLLAGEQQKPRRLPLLLLLAGWTLACLALAGPTWQQLPVPVSKNQHPLVVVIDLSRQMYATDLSPNRLTRTRYKLQDLFRQRRDGVTALVSYAGSAHTVAPLTDDSRTLINLTKALSPDIMPVPGNDPVAAVQLAQQLITQGSHDQGDILLVTGSITADQAKAITTLLNSSKTHLSILGIGTTRGAPIALPEGGLLKNSRGAIVVPKLNQVRLQALAQDNGGQYHTMTIGDQDLKALLPNTRETSETVVTGRNFDQWYDAGYWLLWLLLPLALFGFRRGWLLVVLAVALPIAPNADAFTWDDLWQTRDQQGQAALKANDPARAATLFTNPEWKAEAQFQNQQFDQSANLLEHTGSATSAYNRANALAKAGQLQAALDSYDQALALQPDMADAAFNRNLVAQALQQQNPSQQEQPPNSPQQEQQPNPSQQEQPPNSPQQERQPNSSQQNQQPNSPQQEQQPNSSQQNQPPNSPHQEQQPNSSEQEQQPNPSQQNQQPNPSQQEQNNNQTEAAKSREQQGQPEPQNQPAAKASQHQQPPRQTPDEAGQQRLAQDTDTKELTPEEQAIEGWMRTIPDDPGGLLRRKFLQQRSAQQQTAEGMSW